MTTKETNVEASRAQHSLVSSRTPAFNPYKTKRSIGRCTTGTTSASTSTIRTTTASDCDDTKFFSIKNAEHDNNDHHDHLKNVLHENENELPKPETAMLGETAVPCQAVIQLQKEYSQAHNRGLEMRRGAADRLPSKNVSFQSAECLSVTELHCYQSYFHQNDRSVRVTAVILHRHVAQSDASVCLVLGDAWARETDTPNNSTSNRVKGVGENIQTPRRDTNDATPSRATFHTPCEASSEKDITLTNYKTPQSCAPNSVKRHSKLFSSVKRKMVHRPKTTTTTTTPGKNNRLLRTNNKTRRLSFSTTTLAESTINCLLLKKPSSFLAIVNPQCHPHISNCGVGDIVMLMGELVMVHQEDDPHVQTSHPRAQSFLSLYFQQLDHRREKNKKDDKTATAVASSSRQEQQQVDNLYYLLPRIVRSVNTSNVRLQYEAILKRREYIRLMSNDDPNQPGCGPPIQVEHLNYRGIRSADSLETEHERDYCIEIYL